jgi:hypothetical protein
MSADVEAALALLKRRFLDRAADDLQRLLDYAAGAPAIGRREVQFIVHRLAGAAGTFGFGSVSRAAGRVEGGWLSDPGQDPIPLEPLIAELKAMIADQAAIPADRPE